VPHGCTKVALITLDCSWNLRAPQRNATLIVQTVKALRLDFELIGSDVTPLGTVTLHRYLAETGEQGYEIRLDGSFLMATHGACGEAAMPRLAHQLLAAPEEAELAVLIGGLGAGHTLARTLELPGIAAVQVVEISAKVVAWSRRCFGCGPALDDRRVTVVVGDLLEVLPRQAERFDLLLLDVDNGPGWLVAEGNAALYERAGVELCRRALKPGGVLAVWSPEPNAVFRATLAAVFGPVQERRTADLAADPDTTIGDVVYLATR